MHINNGIYTQFRVSGAAFAGAEKSVKVKGGQLPFPLSSTHPLVQEHHL